MEQDSQGDPLRGSGFRRGADDRQSRPGGKGLSEPVRRRNREAPAGPGLQARRLALLALFEGEFGAAPPPLALERLGRERAMSSDVRRHAAEIVEGVEAHRAQLDERIAGLAPAIPVAELGRVERTILRSALYEVLYSAATPSGEVIRDSVALARIYAGDAARRLVNGVLGSVSRSSAGGG